MVFVGGGSHVTGFLMADVLGMGAQRDGSEEGHKLVQGLVLLLVLLEREWSL